MLWATRRDPETSTQVGQAAIASASAAAPTSAIVAPVRRRRAPRSPTITTASTTTAASAHAQNATPSADTPPARTSANGIAREGESRVQSRWTATRQPSVSSIDSAVISLTDPSSSYAYTSAGRTALSAANAAHGRSSPIVRASSHAGPAASASMNALNGWKAQINGRRTSRALPPNSVSAPEG